MFYVEKLYGPINMINFERGFDPPFVKLRGKVLAPIFLYFLEVVKDLCGEPARNPKSKLRLIHRVCLLDYSYIAANFNAGCSIRAVIF